MEDGRIKVSTGALLLASDQVMRCVGTMRGAFSDLDRTVENAASFWEGSGYTAHASALLARRERIGSALRRFEEHVKDLKAMAGIYEAAEKEAEEFTADLPSDVII